MALEKITKIAGKGVYVSGDDVDTDRIIPARFMKCVTFDGLGEYLFYDVRKHEDGTEKRHNLNDPRFAGASILIAGNNFGCGSSREHAPQAIYRAGFRAVIAEGFAEIFFGNSTMLGMPCVKASREDIKAVVAAVEADPATEITVDVEKLEICFGDRIAKCFLRDGARSSLINGTWDPISELLEGSAAVDAVAASLSYMQA